MRYKVTVILFVLIPICVLGQKDITGVWYGTIIKNGEKNRVIEPKWTINNKE